MLKELNWAKFLVEVNGQHLKKYFLSMWDDEQWGLTIYVRPNKKGGRCEYDQPVKNKRKKWCVAIMTSDHNCSAKKVFNNTNDSDANMVGLDDNSCIVLILACHYSTQTQSPPNSGCYTDWGEWSCLFRCSLGSHSPHFRLGPRDNDFQILTSLRNRFWGVRLELRYKFLHGRSIHTKKATGMVLSS